MLECGRGPRSLERGRWGGQVLALQGTASGALLGALRGDHHLPYGDLQFTDL